MMVNKETGIRDKTLAAARTETHGHRYDEHRDLVHHPGFSCPRRVNNACSPGIRLSRGVEQIRDGVTKRICGITLKARIPCTHSGCHRTCHETQGDLKIVTHHVSTIQRRTAFHFLVHKKTHLKRKMTRALQGKIKGRTITK